MVVGVFKADLDGIVVDVADRNVGFHARNVHRLELEIGHRSGGVLRESLIDADSDFGIFGHIPFDEVRGKDFFGYVLRVLFHS